MPHAWTRRELLRLAVALPAGAPVYSATGRWRSRI